MTPPTQLREYRKKRDFRRSPEPKGKEKLSAEGQFVVQKHDASRLHYDLRLEMGGVLKSWAVPKGPSLDPGEKRLAVHVEDHPLEYGGFEGTIPEGQYGAGTVMVWDRGRWEPRGDPEEGYKAGKLHFRLHGEKLRGGWVLVRMQGKRSDGGKNWLLFKEKDDEADKADILEERPESTLSGRRLWEIEQGLPDGKGAGPSKAAPEKLAGGEAKKRRRRRPGMVPSDLHQAKKAEMPRDLCPQLATLVQKVPGQEGWLHEIKFDGYRFLCHLRGGKARLMTRGGVDWTKRFSGIAQACAGLPAKEAIVDGEVVALREDGSTDFQALQNSLKGRASAPIVYYVFDLPYADGYDLRQSPLVERKELLRRLMESRDKEDSRLRYSHHIEGRGAEVYDRACRMQAEGIICKKSDAPYQSKRTKSWIKVKCINRQELAIGGFTDPGGSRKGFGALLLGYYEGDDFIYCGKVGTGFDDKLLGELSGRLKRIEQKAPAFKNPPRGAEARGAHWVRPELVGEVEFTERTQEGSLRHPSFLGLREDKPAREVVWEAAAPPPPAGSREKNGSPSRRASRKSPPPRKPSGRRSMNGSPKRKTEKGKADGPAVFAGVQLSNPDRVLFPEQGLTKRALAEYYERIADWVLPHVTGRPLTLVRCPQGRDKNCFFQKHMDGSMPEAVRGVRIKEKKGASHYLVIDDLAGLVSLVQLGVLEIHTWGSRADNVEKPDLLIFDLDPDPSVSWGEVIESARVVGGRLAELGLRSFVKTSGGKGLHVVAPIAPRLDWDEVKDFAKAAVEDICREMPGRYVSTMSKAKRRGKIFIDHFRNGRGATSVAAYSSRAKPGAPVSAPVHWDELSPRLKADSFTVSNLPRRLASLRRDPWEGFFKVRQSITAKMKKELGIEK